MMIVSLLFETWWTNGPTDCFRNQILSRLLPSSGSPGLACWAIKSNWCMYCWMYVLLLRIFFKSYSIEGVYGWGVFYIFKILKSYCNSDVERMYVHYAYLRKQEGPRSDSPLKESRCGFPIRNFLSFLHICQISGCQKNNLNVRDMCFWIGALYNDCVKRISLGPLVCDMFPGEN